MRDDPPKLLKLIYQHTQDSNDIPTRILCFRVLPITSKTSGNDIRPRTTGESGSGKFKMASSKFELLIPELKQDGNETSTSIFVGPPNQRNQ